MLNFEETVTTYVKCNRFDAVLAGIKSQIQNLPIAKWMPYPPGNELEMIWTYLPAVSCNA